MIIFCSGMPRSASTWSFNVCRLILQATSREYRADFVGENEKVDQYLREEDVLSQKIDFLLKTHIPGSLALELIESKQAKNICTYRDPRDSICSRLKFQSVPFDMACNNIHYCLFMYDFFKKNTDTLFISFDNVKKQPLEEITGLAQYLDCNLDENQYQKINQETSLENSLKIAENIKNQTSEKLFKSESLIDKTTLLHSNHIFGAKTGRWHDELNLEQKLIVNSLFKPWLLKYNYETEDSFKQLYTSLMTKVNWQEIASKYLIKHRDDYFKVIALYERAIELEPTVTNYYWYLGLALFLQDREEEAHTTWMIPMLEANPEDVDQHLKELLQILQEEIERQESVNNYDRASLIRQAIQQIEQ